MYWQYPQKPSRTASIIFYALCVLYVLSTVNAVLDLLAVMIETVSNNSICTKNIIFFNSVVQMNTDIQQITGAKPLIFHITILQITINGCCDFLAQCILVRMLNHRIYHPFYSPTSSKIYRCWIVWGQVISAAVIVPSLLAITYLGQSIDLNLISRFQFIVSSYLPSNVWCSIILTRLFWPCCLGVAGDANKFRPVHGCEYPGDGLNRVQDPQGVLGT